MNDTVTFPEIIYKYRNWKDEFNKKVLLENELYFASNEDFNDPFDSKIPTDYYLLDTDNKKLEYAKDIVKRQESYLIKNGIDLKFETNRIYKILKLDLNTVHDNFAKIEEKTTANEYGALCLSETWESILMWSHYADSHKGYCIGFKGEQLIKHSVSQFACKINYNNKYPHIDPLEKNQMVNTFKRWQYKAEDWSYEKEYRIVKGLFNGDSNRYLIFPDNYIAEIILGMNIEQPDKEEILAIAKSKNIPVYQTKNVPFEFKLVRDRVL